MVPMTVDDLKAIMPSHMTKPVSQELVDCVNDALIDPEFYQHYRDNLISYTSVIKDGRFKIADYIHAVKYVSYKLLGNTNFEAYIKTFPDRYQQHLANGVSTNNIHAYVSMYNKTKLVNLVFAQTIVPVHVMNMDMYQMALNEQCRLMLNANSEKVRSDAANSIMNQLRPPEVSKVEIDITHKQDSVIGQLRDATAALVASQRDQIRSGQMDAKGIAESKVIQGESREV